MMMSGFACFYHDKTKLRKASALASPCLPRQKSSGGLSVLPQREFRDGSATHSSKRQAHERKACAPRHEGEKPTIYLFVALDIYHIPWIITEHVVEFREALWAPRNVAKQR